MNRLFSYSQSLIKYFQGKLFVFLFSAFNTGFHFFKDLKSRYNTPQSKIVDTSVRSSILSICSMCKIKSYTNYAIKTHSKFLMFDENLIDDDVKKKYRQFVKESQLGEFDTLWILKHANINMTDIVYSSYNNNDRDLDPFVDVSNNMLENIKSDIGDKFVHVEYNSPKLIEPILLDISKTLFTHNNELFTPCFVLYILGTMKLEQLFDIDYTISLVDNACNITTIDHTQYLVIKGNTIEINIYKHNVTYNIQ